MQYNCRSTFVLWFCNRRLLTTAWGPATSSEPRYKTGILLRFILRIAWIHRVATANHPGSQGSKEGLHNTSTVCKYHTYQYLHLCVCLSVSTFIYLSRCTYVYLAFNFSIYLSRSTYPPIHLSLSLSLSLSIYIYIHSTYDNLCIGLYTYTSKYSFPPLCPPLLFLTHLFPPCICVATGYVFDKGFHLLVIHNIVFWNYIKCVI